MSCHTDYIRNPRMLHEICKMSQTCHIIDLTKTARVKEKKIAVVDGTTKEIDISVVASANKEIEMSLFDRATIE